MFTYIMRFFFQKGARIGWFCAFAVTAIGAWITQITIGGSNDGVRRFSAWDAAIFVLVEKVFNIIVFSWLFFAHFHNRSGKNT